MRHRRRLRWKLLVALAIAVAVVGGAAIAVWKVRSRNALIAFKNQAIEAAERGDADQAYKSIQLYVRNHGDDAGLVRDLALTLEKNAKRPADQVHVFNMLELAVALSPQDGENRRQAVAQALELHRFSAAMKHLEWLAAAFPNDATVEFQIGECEEGQGRFEESSTHYARAISRDAGLVSAYERQAELLRTRLSRKEKADAVMNELRNANPNSARALIARARYFRETGRAAEARRDIERAVSLDGDSADVRFAAAQYEMALNHLKAAEEHLRAGLRQNPDHLVSIQLLSEIRKLNPKTSDGQDLRALVLRTLAKLEDNPRRAADVLSLLIDADELAEARRLLAGPKNDWLPSYFRDFLEARLKMAEGDFGRARQLLERCQAQLAPVQALARANDLLLGICRRKLGDPDQAAEAFHAALSISPGWTPAQLELAGAELELGHFDASLGIYRGLMAQVPEVWPSVVRLTMLRLLRQPPDLRDWTPVDQLLATVPESQKRSPEWRLLRADVLWSRGKGREAESELEQAVLAEPNQVLYRLSLVELALRQNQAAKAVEVLDIAEKAVGDRIEIRLARANLAARQPAREAVAALSKLAADFERFPRADQSRLLAGLFRLGSKVDVRFARRMGDKLAEFEPARVDLRFGLLRLALSDNDESAALALVAKLRELEGEGGPFWRCGDVAVRLQFSQPDDNSWLGAARARVREAARARPHWGLPILLQGELDDREGKVDAALQNFRLAIELGERSTAIVRRAVRILESQRRFEEAQELLRQMADKIGFDADLMKLQIPALIGRESPDQILARARKLAPEDSRDYRDHLWMGQLLGALGAHVSDAEKSYRRAVDLAPESTETWVGLVLFLVSSEQKPKALAMLAEAEKRLTSPESAPGLALCQEAAGQANRAEKTLLEAADKRPEDSAIRRGLAAHYLRADNLKQAAPILEKLGRGNSFEAGWARRQQAMLLIRTGPYSRIRQAFRLIEQNLNASEAAPEDRRAKAILLALQPFRRDEAIKALESSFKVLPATGDERLLLAQLYESARNWSAARELLLDVVSGAPAPRHIEYFVSRLLVHNDLLSAMRWANRLEKLDPASLGAAAAKARVLIRLDKRDEATEVLQNFTNMIADPEQLIVVGRVMEELGLFDSAEQVYRRYSQTLKAKNGPAADLPLARHLALRGRIGSVIEIAEAVGGNARPDAVYSVVSAVARWPKLDPGQLTRIERWIKSAQEKSPGATPLYLALAEIHEQRSQADAALSLYNLALAKDPDNVAALNNSAVVLALAHRGDDALKRVNQAIDLVGPLPVLLDTRAMASLALGNASGAIADLEEAIAQEESAVRRFHLALAQKSAGNEKAFGENLQRAKELKLTESSLHPLERDRWRGVQ